MTARDALHHFTMTISFGSLAAVTIIGCSELVADEAAFQNFTCAVVPYYVADCTQPEVQDTVRSVLTDGAVKAEIECTGVALGTGGKFAAVSLYKAQRLQDGACNARVDLFVSSPPTPGLVQSSASELTRRSASDAGLCSVTSFHPPGLRSTITVSGGVVHIEGPQCPTGCTMPVAGNCTGDVSAF